MKYVLTDFIHIHLSLDSAAILLHITKSGQETISCSICLDLLKDPVTTTCGHSYCMNCIKSHWDKRMRRQSTKTIYSCPQCRQDFTPRPVLRKNTMLAVLVEVLKKTGLQAAPADHCYAGPEDVALFCRTDQQSICYLCLMDEHKGHDTVSAAAERSERQRELKVSRQNIQQRIQDREKDVKLLQQEVEAINGSADKTVGNSEKIFTELIRLMEKRRSDVKQQVRSQQQTEVSRVRELQEKLEQEITELKRKDAELEKLSHTEDHNQFLHDYPSLLVMFQIDQKTKDCSKISLTEAWDLFDIPANSTFEDQYIIGGPGDNVEVQEWSDRKPGTPRKPGF
uniref:RING-type domain-containing protein n=1 Tax=Labrus bergylta TaxID=56723 RepID=A0A3Q3N650_9LABR